MLLVLKSSTVYFWTQRTLCIGSKKVCHERKSLQVKEVNVPWCSHRHHIGLWPSNRPEHPRCSRDTSGGIVASNGFICEWNPDCEHSVLFRMHSDHWQRVLAVCWIDGIRFCTVGVGGCSSRAGNVVASPNGPHPMWLKKNTGVRDPLPWMEFGYIWKTSPSKKRIEMTTDC